MGLNIFARLRALLALPDAVRRELRSLERAVERAEARAAKAGDAERKNAARAVEQLRKDLEQLTRQLHLQLEQLTRQLHLQMARLTMLAEGRSAPAALGGRALREQEQTRRRGQHISRADARFVTVKDAAELDGLPARIEALENEQRALDRAVADPLFYREPADVIATTLARIEAIGPELTACYARWDALESRPR